MKALCSLLLLTFSFCAWSTSQSEYDANNWERVQEDARTNKMPVPSEQAHDEMNKRDQRSRDYNNGGNIPYRNRSSSYDYSDVPDAPMPKELQINNHKTGY